MSKKLDPIISEFETQEAADSYDKWFRAKVEAAIKNPGRLIPHDEAMAHARETIRKAAAAAKKRA